MLALDEIDERDEITVADRQAIDQVKHGLDKILWPRRQAVCVTLSVTLWRDVHRSAGPQPPWSDDGQMRRVLLAKRVDERSQI
jgi:hypothetical protein